MRLPNLSATGACSNVTVFAPGFRRAISVEGASTVQPLNTHLRKVRAGLKPTCCVGRRPAEYCPLTLGKLHLRRLGIPGKINQLTIHHVRGDVRAKRIPISCLSRFLKNTTAMSSPVERFHTLAWPIRRWLQASDCGTGPQSRWGVGRFNTLAVQAGILLATKQDSHPRATTCRTAECLRPARQLDDLHALRTGTGAISTRRSEASPCGRPIPEQTRDGAGQSAA